MAIVAARSRYQRLHQNVPIDKLVIYTTTQTHSLGLKAGLILGLSVSALPVYSEDGYSLRGQGLRNAIARDKAEGKHPFVIGGGRPSFRVYQHFDLSPSWHRWNYIKRRNRQHRRNRRCLGVLDLSPGDWLLIFYPTVPHFSSTFPSRHMAPRRRRLVRRSVLLSGVQRTLPPASNQ